MLPLRIALPLSLLMLLTISLVASESTGDITQTYFLKPKSGSAIELEGALKKHVAHLKSQHDSWTWHVWQIESGERLGQYIVSTSHRRWKDFDEREKLSPASTADWKAAIQPHVESVRGSWYRYIKKASRSAERKAPSRLSQLFVFQLNPGWREQFVHFVGKLKVAQDKTKSPGESHWYELISGGEYPSFVLIHPRDSWSEFDRGKASFWGVLEQAYGRHETDSLRRVFRRATRSQSSEVLRWRPLLSYVPETPEDQGAALMTQLVEYDYEAFTKLGTRSGRKVTLPALQKLFPNESFAASTEAYSEANGISSWQGRLEGVRVGGSSMVFSKLGVFGLVQREELVYLLEPGKPGLLQITQIDQSSLPPEAPIRPVKKRNRRETGGEGNERRGEEEGGGGGYGGFAESIPPDYPIVVLILLSKHDVLAGFCAGTDSKSLMESFLTDHLNTAFQTDATGISARVVVDCVEYVPAGGSMVQDLHWLDGSTDVNTLRGARKADIVCLLTGSGDFGGVSYQNQDLSANWAFAVVQWPSAVAGCSLCHEIGHLCDMLHSFNEASQNGGDFNSDGCNFGHVMTWGGEPIGRTIMAGPQYCDALGLSCPRYLIYSMGNETYNGITLGRACSATGTEPTTAPANNLERLKQVAPIVSHFR